MLNEVPMIKQVVLTTLSLLVFFSSGLAQNFAISGVVKDADGYEVAYASVKDTISKKGTYTNEDGSYIFNAPAGKYVLEFQSLGYAPSYRVVFLSANTTINIVLEAQALELEEVVIENNEVEQKLNSTEMSTEELTVEEIKKIPAFLGEPDVIKSIQLLPGVTTVGEGATGFNVRGGNIDQNLILADNASIYSSSHLFGFFSVFNPDAVSDLKLYKGSIPARFGERVSSVLDVHQRTGDFERYTLDGGIGVVSSRLTVGGPIIKDKASFTLSGRRTYVDQFFRFSPDEAVQNTDAFFYDLNTKLSYIVNENNVLTFTGYLGRDEFNLDNESFVFNWGNRFGVVNWEHKFNDKLKVNSSISHTNYDYTLGFASFFNWTSQISTLTEKADFVYEANEKHTLGFGINNNNHHFRPGFASPAEDFEDSFEDVIVPQEWSMENGVYLQDEMKVTDKLTVLAGLRFSFYNSFGQADEVVYEDNAPKNAGTAIDTLRFNRNEVTATYAGLEPRFSFLYKIDSLSSLKFGYNRNLQYLQLVSNTTSGFPLDVWKAADYHSKPLKSNQFAVGYVRGLFNNQIELTAETYFKVLRDVQDYKNNADLFLNTTLETELLEARGRSYGLELMLRKRKGKFNGWLSYTLSRTELLTKSEFEEETINNGNWYKASWHKPHDVTFVASYDFTKRFSSSLNFVYATGRAITFPDSRYEILGVVIPNYSTRNADRLSDYHRLDLSATLKSKNYDTKKWKGSWVLSIYNVYARRNAFSYTFSNLGEGSAQAERLSLLGTILPSITYNFKF